MKLQLCALALASSLLLATPVRAVEDSTENFIRSKTYQCQFSDLAESSGFYDNVSALYEYGLSIGKPDGSFGLKDSLTVSQVMIFAGRIRSLYRTGDPEAGPAAHAAPQLPPSIPYLRYLKDEGVLGNELDSQLPFPATRAEVAHVLANLLPPEALPPIHAELVTEGYATHQFITDVTEYTPYFQDILQLYRTGISQGCDDRGSYQPDDFITRGAAAAMLTRLVDPALRTELSWYSASGASLSGLVPDATPVPAPHTPAEMDACIRHMLHTGSHTLQLRYPSLTVVAARTVLSQALTAAKSYCEQSYNTASCTFTASGELTITFSSTAIQGELLEACRQDALAAAITVHDHLWKTGAITPVMSELEKARVYFEWMCAYTRYDVAARDNSLSHLPYGLFYSQKAVCDGYTGAYNLLLKLEGIPCTAVSSGSHIWTVAELDGEELHIDVTWGDQEDGPDLHFFAMTPETSQRLHNS